mgnify:CR=1 FL=1
MTFLDPIAQFADAARAAGLEIHGAIVADGKIQRCRIGDDKPGKKNGWYVLHLDGVAAGCFGSWKDGVTHNWCAKSRSDLTAEQDAEVRERISRARALREKEAEIFRARAAVKAVALFAKAGPVDAKHDYVVRKGVRPIGASQLKNMLVIPLEDIDGKLHSLQFIMPDGSKRFLTGGRKNGCFAWLGKPAKNKTKLFVVEGWATGCSVREAIGTGGAVVVCFDAGNLLPVCEALRGKYPDADIIICADDDYQTDGNPGITKAFAAAEAVGGVVAMPDFGIDRPAGATDFNDLHQHRGIDAVRESLSVTFKHLSDPAGKPADVVDIKTRRQEKQKKSGRAGKDSGDGSDLINWDIMSGILQRYVLIYGTDTCYDTQENILMQVKNFRLAVTNDYANLWLKSPQRRMILPDQLVFDPTRTCADECVNTFQGFSMKPKEGRFAPIFELLHHLCAESAETAKGVEDVMTWVLRWLAYPLQHPGAKMRSALVFHGPQGTGKNLFFEIMTAIYGRYALVVGQEQLEMQYNDWQSGKLFLIGDEVIARQELYHQKNKLKSFITGETLQIHPKFMPLRTEKNHINVVFLSNEEQPLALEPADRRYFVVYTPPQRTDGLYDEVSQCIKSGGIEAFYHYLLHLDMADFNEYAKPIMTVAKTDLIELGLKPAQRFMYEWTRGFLPLPLVGCSNDQLYKAFCHWCRLSGVRFIPEKIPFCSSARKALDTPALRDKYGGPPFEVKNVRLPFTRNEQRQAKMWVPSVNGPGDGDKIGEWAVRAMDTFDACLSTFKGGNAYEN